MPDHSIPLDFEKDPIVPEFRTPMRREDKVMSDPNSHHHEELVYFKTFVHKNRKKAPSIEELDMAWVLKSIGRLEPRLNKVMGVAKYSKDDLHPFLGTNPENDLEGKMIDDYIERRDEFQEIAKPSESNWGRPKGELRVPEDSDVPQVDGEDMFKNSPKIYFSERE